MGVVERCHACKLMFLPRSKLWSPQAIYMQYSVLEELGAGRLALARALIS